MPKITIDDRKFEADEGMSVLQVARANGVQIPTLQIRALLEK